MDKDKYLREDRWNKHILDKWSWGAFFLTWVWGIRCRVWISFLTIIPIAGIIIAFILGTKGRRWAWEKGNWKDIEHFKGTQDKWDVAGVVAFMISMLLQLFLYLSQS